jgi:Bacterial pre-peptidase C-terminal domain
MPRRLKHAPGVSAFLILGSSWVGQAFSPAIRRLKPAPPLLLLALIAVGEQNMVDYLTPRGGSRGKTVEVNFYGRELKDPREVVFYRPGIKAVGFTPGAKPAESVKVRFEIAPDCPLGEHPLRLRTATALTDVVTFWVSPFPQVTETEKKIGENDTPEKAQPIPLNSTVEGQILPGDHPDLDCYRIEVPQGKRISVEVESVRLGTLHTGGDNDLSVRILDANGKELGKAAGSAMYVQDPIISLVAPRAGKYFVEIGQQIFAPPRQLYYRAHIGTFSRPTGIYPAGGQAGTELNARILGDPSGERTERIVLPKEPGNFEYFSESAPSANVLRVSPYPNVLKEDGDGPTPVPSLPAALNGILSKSGEVDTFRFSARKNESWQVRVYARTLGSPMDPKISIRPVGGAAKNLLETDDAKPADLGFISWRGTWSIKDTLDPIAIFKAPADGQYLLGITDSQGKAGPEHVYRVEIEPARDAVYTHITSPDGYQIPRLVGLIVPQGNRWTLDVQLAPGFGNNYKGDIELEAAGLPRGVSMIAPRYTKGVNRLPVQFVAAPQAEQQAALVELRARPVDRSVPLQTGSRQTVELLNRPVERPLHFLFLNKYALAVTQPAPFHIELEQPDIALAQNGELALKVKVARHGNFKEPVEILPDWLPPNVSKEAAVTIPADKSESVFKIRADNKAAPGVYKIAMNATTKGGDAYSGVGRIRVSSPFVELKVAEPYLGVELQRASLQRGQRGQIVGVLKHNQSFQGRATVSLKRLPRGVKMLEPAPQITSKDQQVVFQIEAEPDALVGLYKDIFCEVTVTENGQSIRQQTGSGVLRVDPARVAQVPDLRSAGQDPAPR